MRTKRLNVQFSRFLGVAEVAVTPLAAAGLVIVMTGATVITVLGGQFAAAVVPSVVGLLSGLVAYVRWQPSRAFISLHVA